VKWGGFLTDLRQTNSMKFKLGCVVFFGLLTGCSSSKYSAGIGAYSGGIKSVSKKASGATGLLAPLAFPVGVRGEFEATIPWILAVDYTPLARKSPEGQIKNTYLLTRALVRYQAHDQTLFAFAFGPSLNLHTQKGSGVTVNLPNGNSTADFLTPNYSVTTKIYSLNAVVDARFGPVILKNEFFLQNFFKKDRWNLAYLGSLHYQFGGL
jgi:hypothetical protein